MTKTFTGVHWMLATPFLDDEEVDVNSISNLMEKAYSSRCEGVVVLGVTGESARLTDEERQIITKVQRHQQIRTEKVQQLLLSLRLDSKSTTSSIRKPYKN